jgi:hypothetical protein
MSDCKIKITLNLDYSLNGASVQKVINAIEHTLDELPNNGNFHGYTDAEVDSWSYEIEVCQ